jgi:hypothetical protein
MFVWDPETEMFISVHEMGDKLKAKAKELNVQMSSQFEFDEETAWFKTSITDYDFYSVLSGFFTD